MTSGPSIPADADEAAQIIDALEAVYDPAQGPTDGAPVTLHADALAAAAYDREGAPCVVQDRFNAWFEPAEVEAVMAAWRPSARPNALLTLASRTGATTVILVGKTTYAAQWAIPASLAATLAKAGAASVAVAYRPFEVPALADAALASWRLTPLEAKTVRSLISAGDLQAGAKSAGLGYETARKALKLALRKAGTGRQTDLVRRLHIAVGSGDLKLAQAEALSVALGISLRSAGVSILLALGLTRSEAAATLHVSAHTLKDELTALYYRFGLRTAIDLSRMTTEALVLLGAASNPHTAAGTSWSTLRPLRFVGRADGLGRIALSDFGPASGDPTLLFHSATTGSLLDRGLVAALQSAGSRPIAIERPGFGLTDPPDGDPLEVAVSDVLTVMHTLGLRRVRLVCRGGEPVAMALAGRVPERLARAVLINPFTPYDVDSRWDGFMNKGKRLVSAYPEMIEPLARFLSRRATPESIERLVRSALRDSVADHAAFENRAIVEDYVESARLMGVRSMWGFVNDQKTYRTWRPPVLADGRAWVRLVGGQDVLYRTGDAEALWEAALPGHNVRHVPDAGRMLHASHPQLVAEALSA